MRKDWTLIRKIRGGHSYWQRVDGEIGIADDSGTYPENCEPADDPPLLLDRTRPIALFDGHYGIPLKHENGRTSATFGSAFEALWVAAQWRMSIHAVEKGGKTIEVRVVDADTYKLHEGALETLRSL